jgi:hypothetical protein
MLDKEAKLIEDRSLFHSRGNEFEKLKALLFSSRWLKSQIKEGEKP